MGKKLVETVTGYG